MNLLTLTYFSIYDIIFVSAKSRPIYDKKNGLSMFGIIFKAIAIILMIYSYYAGMMLTSFGDIRDCIHYWNTDLQAFQEKEGYFQQKHNSHFVTMLKFTYFPVKMSLFAA